jgi:hypothetical protein
VLLKCGIYLFGRYAKNPINEDELADLVCHFNTEKTGFVAGDLRGVLKGTTLDGSPIIGSDVVQIK